MNRAETDDADLAALTSCANGNAAALDELFWRHSASCFGLALSILRDRDYAQDAVQEAYLNLWRQADRFDGRQSSVRSWLLLMTRSRAIDRVRHEERRKTAALPVGHDAEDDAPGPEAQALLDAAAVELRDAMMVLSPPKREALVLAYWGGYTQREIAEITRAALGTVKTRTMHAMAEVRGVLEAQAADRGEPGFLPVQGHAGTALPSA